jgi:hypothetical protein
MPQPRLARITANSRFKTAAEVAEHMAKLARDPQLKILTPGMTRDEYIEALARNPSFAC